MDIEKQIHEFEYWILENITKFVLYEILTDELVAKIVRTVNSELSNRFPQEKYHTLLRVWYINWNNILTVNIVGSVCQSDGNEFKFGVGIPY